MTPGMTSAMDQRLTLTLPPNWAELDLRDLVAELVSQKASELYFGQVEPNPRHLGQLDPTDDDTFTEDPFQASSEMTSDRTDYGQTEGGSLPWGMMRTLVGHYPTDGTRLYYYTQSDGEFCRVFRQITGSNSVRGNPVEVIDEFPISEGVVY